jgi:iduronate 2-sulfatase
MARGLLWSWAVLGLTATLAAAEPERRYNVVWIIADDLNTDIGCYGQPLAQTPNIDRLAARGVRFDRAYAQYALCNPSRSSFLSGYFPNRTGVIEQDVQARQALPDAVFLPQCFRNHGYFVAAAGKIHHGGKHIDRPSWDDYSDDKGSDPQETAAAAFRKGTEDRTPKWAPLDGDGSKTQDGVNTRKIVGLIEAKSRQPVPFFLALGLHRPHVPWSAPRTFFDRFPPAEMPLRDLLVGTDIPRVALRTEWPIGTKAESSTGAVAAYLACVSFADANVGLVLETLDRLELWDQTIVVFMGDHGFHLGDHGLWSKKTLFEQTLRVPLVVVLPDGRSAGRTCRRTVELLDIYPTLADLCHLRPPGDLHGASLRPLLDNPDARRDRPGRSMVVHDETIGRSVRTERWRYTEWDEGHAGVEFYDHDTDPLEQRNLASVPELAGAARTLAALLRSSQP